MKTIPAALQTHLNGEVTTLATCWKLKLKSGTIMGFTDFEKDLVISSVTYQSISGFVGSAVSTSSDLAVDNMDLEGMLRSDAIKEQDIMAGIYDYAEIEIFQVNYNDVSQGVANLKRGRLGEVQVKGQNFVVEVRGLTQSLSQEIGEYYSPACRANLGDTRCKVNLTPHTKTGSVTGITSTQQFLDTARTEAIGYFNFGKITFTSGLNNGLSVEVKEYSPGKITLVMPMPYTIAVGNTYTIIAGCDKTLVTCKNTFSNVVNFRGEPHVPGSDRMLQTAGTRTTW